MSRYGELAETATVFVCFGNTILLAGIWTVAYLNGGTAVIAVDAFGEARAELLLWMTLAPVVAYGLYHWHQRRSPV